MRKRVLLSLLVLLVLGVAGAGVAMVFIHQATEGLEHVVTLENLDKQRLGLVGQIRAVQSDLYVATGESGSRVGALVGDLRNLRAAASDCQGCHHQPEVARSLEEIGSLVDEYEAALNAFLMASGDPAQVGARRTQAAEVGARLLLVTEEMSAQASARLAPQTYRALELADEVRNAILGSLLVAVLAGVVISWRLSTAVTRPVGRLVEATGRIRDGELGYTIAEDAGSELGELARNFNTMSRALREGYQELQHEIAERREAEDEVRRSEAFLRTLIDSIRDPFIIFDPDCKVVHVNAAYARLRTKPIEPLIGQTSHQVFAIPEKSPEECVILRTFASGLPARQESWVRTPDNGKVWLDVHTYPVGDDDGRVTHVIAYCRDVTARKQIEEALRASNERYELAALGANDGLWDWDLKSGRIHFSGRWNHILGAPDVETTGDLRAWLDRVHPADVERLEREINAHLDGATPSFKSEYRIAHADGSWRWVMSRGLAIRDVAGRAYRIAGSQSDVTQRKTYEQQLIHHAHHDPLTGLPNRLLLRDRLIQSAARAREDKEYQFGVLFLDLDRFKVINDTLGHEFGDRFLVAVSERLKDAMRTGDAIGRIGGDEFVVILDGIANPQAAVRAGERVREALAEPFVVGTEELTSDASIGVALSSTGFDEAEDLLRYADIAMYRAKAGSDGKIVVFDRGTDAATIRRLKLETGLRKAVERQELCLHYQPILSLDDDRIVGLEALLRWHHPHRGLLYPESFLPLAEKTGLIVSMGLWVMREAFRQMRALRERLGAEAPSFISVNLSSRQLAEPDLVTQVARLLRETDLDPRNVRLEITETSLVENTERAAAMLAELQELGVRLCLDDFGTGYSSLRYLDRFPINTLKIDRSFIRQMKDEEKAPEIVRAIVSLAKKLAIDVVAEGVESPHQLAQTKVLRCEYVQGNLISKPVVMEEIEEFIASRAGAGSAKLAHPVPANQGSERPLAQG